MTSRRELMKYLALVPAAPVLATKELTALLASPAVNTALAASAAIGGGIGEMSLPQSTSHSIFGKLLGNKLQFLRELSQEEIWNRRNTRSDGFDHDIAALKSTSRSYKVSKQLERDNENSAFLARVQRILWGEEI